MVRGNGYFPVKFVSMTQYDATFTGLEIVNPPETMKNTLGEYLSSLGLTQLRIAETQKYAHVTFFFNGGVETPNQGEDRILVPSSKVATFDMDPEMSAYEVAGKAIHEINMQTYDVMILNFANCDMVGHTGIMDAAVKAVKAVDDCVWGVTRAILNNGGRVFITADHGNADMMVDPKTGEPFTAHTTNPVPFIAVGGGHDRQGTSRRRKALRYRADAASKHGDGDSQRDDGNFTNQVNTATACPQSPICGAICGMARGITYGSVSSTPCHPCFLASQAF